MTHKEISKYLDKKLELDHCCMGFALIYNDDRTDIYWIHDIDEDIIEFNESFNSMKEYQEIFDDDMETINYINLKEIDKNLIEIKQFYF